MKKYYVDVLMPDRTWYTACGTSSESDAKEFERKQKINGRKTRLYSQPITQPAI